MAYSFPSTVSTGDVLAASTWNQAIRENQKFGMATFTNEAARDAAITSPEEGMRAYLTAPTVPAATGATTALPTGITTIYNGTNWVCATPVSAFTATNGTTTSTSFTATLTSGGTNPSVTLVTGTTALVMVSATTSCTSGFTHNMGVAVSGATTLAASTEKGTYSTQSTANRHSDQYVLTGLTAGTNTFTLQYITASGTASFAQRNITVFGIA
jgi:hypothetical protein